MKELKQRIADKLIIFLWLSACTIIILLAIPFIPLVLLYACFSDKKFEKEYKQYLQQINGACFFCYNNRKSSVAFARDTVIPKLDPSVEIVFVDGLEVNAIANKEFISKMLWSVKKKKGFPYLLKIVDDRVLDCSINNQFYNTLNGNKPIEPLLASINAFYKSSIPSPN